MGQCPKVGHVYNWSSRRRGEVKGNGAKQVFEEIKTKMFPNLVKGIITASKVSIKPKQNTKTKPKTK